MTDTPLQTLEADGLSSPTQVGAGLSLAGPGDFFALMKPRVMSLVVFTAVVGLVAAIHVSGQSIGWLAAAMAIFCIALGAGASGALNMWYDADIDAKMTRTRKRPVPRGALSPRAALGFGTTMAALSVYLLGVATNWLAAAWLAFTIFFYVIIYTMWLKRRTPQNIVIGGAPGAFPPLIGWAAVTGTTPIEAWVLFAITFIWTPPHFWALALYKVGDYAKVGIPMMPNVRGAASTRLQILIYSVLLFFVGLGPIFVGMLNSSLVSGALLAALGAGFLFKAWQVFASRAGDNKDGLDDPSLYAVVAGDRAARDLFLYSLIYLFGVFAVILADATTGVLL
jgi:protoheme IX farnesyltransferase